MAGDLPDGFTVDQPTGGLPTGFTVDAPSQSGLPAGFNVDQPNKQPYSGIGAPQPGSIDYKGMTGEINPVSYAMQKTGQAGETASSILAAPFKGISYLSTLGDPTTAADNAKFMAPINNAANYASGAITKAGNYISNLGTGDKYTGPSMADIAKQDYNTIPKEGREDIQSIPGMLSLAAPVAGKIGAFTGPVSSAPSALSKFASSVITPPQEAIDKVVKETGMLTGDQVNDITAHRYNTAYSLGANVNPTGTNKIIDTIADMNPVNKGASATRGSGSTMQGVTSRWNDQLRGQSLTIHDLDGMNKELGDMIQTKPDGSLTNDGRQVLKSQSKLREMMLNPAETDVDGGTQGFQQLSKATKTAAIGFKVGDLEDIVNASANANQPEQYMKQRFRNILNNGNAIKAYPPDEVNIMKDIVNSNLSDEIKRGVGSRALPMLVAGTTGKLGDAAIASLAGIGSRNAAFSARLYKVAELRNAITSKLPDLAPVAGDPPIRTPTPHPSAAGYNPGTEPIPSAMHADFVKNPSPTDLGPIGSASIPGQASFVRQPNPTDLGYVGGASLPGPAGYVQEPHPSAAGYRGSPVNVQDVANAGNPRPSYGAVGNLGFGKPISKVNLPLEEWPGYVAKEEGQNRGGKIKGKIGFNLKKSRK